MDGNEVRPRPPGRVPRRWLAPAGLLATGLLAGGILAGSRIAGAQSAASTPAATTQAATAAGDPARVGHGPDESLLTGTTASRVRAAALQAVPGGTVLRVETDSEGSPYEAHVQKSDGTVVTVKVDKNFKVTDTISGFGAGPMHSGSNGTGA